MGFFDRAWKVATGVGGAAQAPLGFVKDMAQAPFKDEEEFDGFFNTLYKRGVARGSQAVGNLIGPDEGLGAVIGGLPEAERKALGTHVINPVLDTIDTIGREGIREPLSTLLTMGSLADSKTYGKGWGTFFEGDSWRDAYKIAQDRSVGQSTALMFGTKDILDPNEVQTFMHTDLFNVVSGTVDAAAQIGLDPTVIGGKIGKAANTGRKLGKGQIIETAAEGKQAYKLGKRAKKTEDAFAELDKMREMERIQFLRRGQGLRRVSLEATAAKEGIKQAIGETKLGKAIGYTDARSAYRAFDADLKVKRAWRTEQFFNNQGWRDLDGFVSKLDEGVDDVLEADHIASKAARVRDRYFSSSYHGGDVAFFIARAANSAERKQIMRFFLGDGSALRELTEHQSSIASYLRSYVDSRAGIKTTTNTFDDAMATWARSQTADGLTDMKVMIEDAQGASRLLERLVGTSDEAATEALDAASKAGNALENSDLFAVLKTTPRDTLGVKLRQGVVRSEIYQSPLGKPVRVFADMRPHAIFSVHDKRSDVQMDRLARDAGMDLKNREVLRGQWQAADAAQRAVIYETMESKLYKQFQNDYGLSDAELDMIKDAATKGRGGLAEARRAYAGKGEDRMPIFDDEGVVTAVKNVPLLETQLADEIYTPDFSELRKQARRVGKTKLRQQGIKTDGLAGKEIDALLKANAALLRTWDVPSVAMSKVMGVWRPAVLLRPAWPIRVVGEEQIRMMVKLDSMVDVLSNWRTGLRNYSIDVSNEVGKNGGRIVGGVSGFVAAGPVGGAVGALAGGKIVNRIADAEKLGIRQSMFSGYNVARATGEDGSLAEKLVSAKPKLDEFVNAENRSMSKMDRGGYTAGIRSGMPEYKVNYEKVINRQLRQSEIVQQVLAGKTNDEIADWLTTDPAGIKLLTGNPVRGADPDNWAQNVRELVHNYTGGSDEIADMLAEGKYVSYRDLADRVPEEARPVIHGNILDATLADGKQMGFVKGFIDKGMKILGAMPTDNLSRMPYYDNVYGREMERLISTREHAVGRRLHESELRRMENQARGTALQETRSLLYDLAEQSDFAAMARTFMPFFNAYQEVLTRWVGLAIENPGAVSRIRTVLNSPEKAGHMYVDEETGEEYYQMRLPEFAKGLIGMGPFKSALDSQGFIRLPKSGVSIVTAGPGFGPFAAIAANEVASYRPDLEESLKFVLPYGAGGSALDIASTADKFMPASVRRVFSSMQGTEDRSFRNAYYMIIKTRLTDMQVNNPELAYKIENDPQARAAFLEDSKREAQDFMKLRTVASFISPIAPIFDSPYRPYLEDIQRMRNEDPATADARFLETHGEEYFALTQSMSKAVDGVPSTLESEEVRNEHKNLIAAYPELGALIVGVDGGGVNAQFSRAMYDKSFRENIGPGNETKRRVPMTPEEMVTQPQVRLGWEKFSRYMDVLDLVRIQAKLPSLSADGAEELADAKFKMIQLIGQQHPEWYAEYLDAGQNPLKWPKRIDGLRAISKDKNLGGRPDMQGVTQYLKYRDLITGMLLERRLAGESGTLDAESNADLAEAWDDLVSRVKDDNPAFAHTYHRWLERDQLDNIETLPKRQKSVFAAAPRRRG